MLYIPKYTDAAVENIRALPKNIKNVLRKEIDTVIAKDPLGCSEELEERLAGFRSRHVWDYRIVFKVYEDLRAFAIVGVGKKAPPDSIYQKLEQLAATGKLADGMLEAMRLFGSPR